MLRTIRFMAFPINAHPSLSSKMNIVTQLQQRQISQTAWAHEQQLASSLPARQILLSTILDRNKSLLDSHVILGFSRCGNLLLSYRSELDITTTQSSYTLYCWYFSGICPLSYVCKEPLFRGETAPAGLHLIVCQTPSPTHTVVVGCRKTCTEDFHRPCYVSILPCLPPSINTSHSYSLHCKFDLMPPFPAFIPSLSLKVPNCVIVNIGDSLVALHYYLPMTKVAHHINSFPTNYSAKLVRRYLSVSATNSPDVSNSPLNNNMLPVDVYCEDQLLIEVCDVMDSNNGVCVKQVCLDVEFWMNETLQAELSRQGFTYHSLTDYDIQLTEVCADSGCAVLIIVVLLEAAGSLSSTCVSSYSADVMASWNIHTGNINCLHISSLKLSQSSSYMTGVKLWNPALPLALSYRHRYTLPLLPSTTVRSFSNHTVFSGKSLRYLHHTFLPLSLTLTQSTHTSPTIN